MPNKIKVFFFPTTNAGVVWQRMFQFFKYMRDSEDFSPAMDDFDPNRMTPYEWQFKKNHNRMILAEIEKIVSQADIVVFQFILADYGLAILDGLQHLFPRIPFLAEIDDYCLQINNDSPAFRTFLGNTEHSLSIRKHLEMSDAMIVSTPYLAKLYEEFNKNYKIIPNGIDFKIWDKLQNPPKHERIRIGWAGASTHHEDLRYVKPVIDKILEKYPDVEFFFMGGTPDFLVNKHPRIIADNCWKNPYKYPQYIKNKGFDIGIAPLLDNNFNRGKSNLRWLEYSALNIPTVASCVEDFKRTIQDGKTGFLCLELGEWEKRLSLLIEDEKLRREMGQNANDEVREKFNIEKISKEYMSFLKEFLDDFGNNKKQV
jgi:glycosyltransferase involved in cell wall biosynthesis